MQTKHLSGKLKFRDHLGDLSFVGKITLKTILKKEDRDMEWFHLTQHEAMW
jgi:hypothetical protein